MDESGGFIDWATPPDGKRHHARPGPVDRTRCAVCGHPIKRTNPPGMGASFKHKKETARHG